MVVLSTAALGAVVLSFVLGRWSADEARAIGNLEATQAGESAVAGTLAQLAAATKELQQEVRRLRSRTGPGDGSGERTALTDSAGVEKRLVRIEEALSALLQRGSGATPAVAFARGLRSRLPQAGKRTDRLLALFREFGSKDIYTSDSPLTERFHFLTPPELLTDLGRPDGIEAGGSGMEWTYEVETTSILGEKLRRGVRAFYQVSLTLVGGMVIQVTGVSEKRM